MKIEVNCRWSDDDMKTFPHLNSKDFKVLVDEDYIEDEDELIGAIADEVYREYAVVIPERNYIRDYLAVNFYDVLETICDHNENI